MNFFRVEDNSIIEGPIPLPRMWSSDNGVQYPLAEMWSKGHTGDVIALGWLPEEVAAVQYDPDTHYVSSYSYEIGPDKVMATPVLTQRDDADIVARKLPKINEIAYQKIVAMYPEWKQRNLSARGLELLKKQVAEGSLSAAEEQEIADIQAVWDSIKAIRAYSDSLEQAVATDPLTDINAGWPEQ